MCWGCLWCCVCGSVVFEVRSRVDFASLIRASSTIILVCDVVLCIVLS